MNNLQILYIMSSYNIYGGTPKKTLDLLKHFKNNGSLYVYSNSYSEFKHLFSETGASVYEGNYGRNIFLHIKELLKIIDKEKIDIVQTQFSMGETLGFLIKFFRPHVKLVVAFVGPFEPKGIRKKIVNAIYKKVDAFVYISNYVRDSKTQQFPRLLEKKSKIIYNGTHKREITQDEYPSMKSTSLYSTSGLVDWKNIMVLVEALNVLKDKNIYLYVAGDGSQRKSLEQKIEQYDLTQQVYLLGYQKNIGALLDEADIYVHPAYAEGFGIAVAEAMIVGKPMIVSNQSALPELVEDNISGLVVEALDKNAWAEAIKKLVYDKELANEFGQNAKKRAESKFSIEKYIANYEELYLSLVEKK